MSNYTKTTNFAAKDSLPSGNAAKIVKGTEIDTEFNNIATASATKANTNNAALTGTTTFETISDGTIAITAFVDEDNMASDSATLLPTQQSVKAYVDSQVTAQDLDVTDGSTSIDIDLDSESLGILGGTGIDSTASGTGVTLAIDSTVATLTGSQTLTNKTLSTPVVSGNLTTDGLLDGRDVAADGTKLDGIESGATADQTAAEIKTAYESNADTNAFTDADESKLDGIEASADVTDTANVTAAGALMDSELTSEASVKALNQGVATTDSPTFAGVTAPITGNVTGNLTGNVTGNVTGDVTGDLTGDVTGNVTGNLTGSVLTAAQTNITSVGTLGSLTVSGDVTVDTNTLKVDSTNNRVGILNASPDVTLDVGSATDAVHVPTGTTAQRPTGAAGYFRYNSTLEQFEGYTDAWGAIGGGGGSNLVSDTMTGDGVDTTLTLSNDPLNENNTQVYIDGVYQNKDTYSVSGTTLTFSTAPPSGSAVEAMTIQPTAVNVPADASVTSAKLSGDLVTPGNLDVTGTVTADGLTVSTSGTNAEAYFDNGTQSYRLLNRSSDNAFSIFDNTASAFRLTTASNGDISFYNSAGTSQSLFWDASAESLGIGTSSPAQALVVSRSSGNTYLDVSRATQSQGQVAVQLTGGTGGTNWIMYQDTSSDDLKFFGNSATRMTIDSSGRVGIGVTNPSSYYAKDLVVAAADEGGVTVVSDPAHQAYLMFADGTSGSQAYRGYIGYDHGSDNFNVVSSGTMRFYTDDPSVEAMRISGGNLLVGTTSAGGSNGITLHSSGYIQPRTTTGIPAIYADRLNSDGSIIELRKDGTSVGSIGAFSVGTSALFFGSLDTALLANSGNDSIHPWNASTNSSRDNAIDLGNASNRFDDIYATNGTIQTSDRNEKQDIEELSEAEQRVAVVAKGLLRKFRWKSSVAEKGDEARTHFGIIAQDLQAAFEAEGLDAGRYAMFINSTWTDEETGEERSRMGVRYSELLAFIIAAI